MYFDGEWPEVFLQADTALLDHLEKAGLQLNWEAFREDFRARMNAYYAERESEFIEYTTAYVLKEALASWGYLGVPDSTVRPALNAMYHVSQAFWQTEPDAHSTLQALSERGLQLGLISNAGDDTDVQTLVDKTGLRHELFGPGNTVAVFGCIRSIFSQGKFKNCPHITYSFCGDSL